MGQTYADLNQEMVEDLLLRRKEIKAELEQSSRPQTKQEFLLEQLRHINKVLGEDLGLVTGDDLADYWDAQIDRGEEPDLDMTVEDLQRLKDRGLA